MKREMGRDKEKKKKKISRREEMTNEKQKITK